MSQNDHLPDWSSPCPPAWLSPVQLSLNLDQAQARQLAATIVAVETESGELDLIRGRTPLAVPTEHK